MEEQRGRVVVSRARRGIIHPTKVAALRQEQGPTLTTYSGRRRARSIRVRRGEEVRAAGPSSRARFLAPFFSASFHLHHSSSPLRRSSVNSLLPHLCRSARDASPMLRIRRPYPPLSPATIFLSCTRPSFSPSPRALQPSPRVFIHPHRSCQTCDLSDQTRVPTCKSLLRFVMQVIFKR